MKKLTEEKIPEITVKVKRGKFAKSKKIDLPEQTISETASKIDVVFDKSVEEIIDKTQDQKTEKPKIRKNVFSGKNFTQLNKKKFAPLFN